MTRPQTMPRRLFLSLVPEDFRLGHDVALGPWCFFGREDRFSDWESLDFLACRSDFANEHADANNLIEFAEALTVQMSEDFNTRHGVEFGRAYWRVLLVPWILVLLQPAVKRYRMVERFVDEIGTSDFVVETMVAKPSWSGTDVRAIATDLIDDEAFHYWLTSRIVEKLAPPSWTLIANEKSVPRAAASLPIERPPSGVIHSYLRDRFYDLRCRRVTGIRFTAPLLSAWLNLLPPKRSRRDDYRPSSLADTERKFPSALLEIMRTLLREFVPRTLEADFKRYQSEASQRRFKAGKINLVGPIMFYDEREKFTLANAVENGERIVCTQHGGGSGLSRFDTLSTAIEHRQDAFFSWGWLRQNARKSRTIPVPSSLYSRSFRKFREREPKLCLAGCLLRVTGFQLAVSHSPAEIVAIRKEKISFLEHLPTGIRENTVYRPYPPTSSYVLEDVPYLLKRFPTMEIDTGPIDRAMQTFRLLVIDHISTVFCHAVAFNRPTIGFWDTDPERISVEARPYVQALRDAKIVFDSGPEAARHIAEIWNDVPAWWNSPEVQEPRRDFVEAYAKTSRLWLFHWLGALRRV